MKHAWKEILPLTWECLQCEMVKTKKVLSTEPPFNFEVAFYNQGVLVTSGSVSETLTPPCMGGINE